MDMSTQELYKEIKNLEEKDLWLFLARLLSDDEIIQEIERLGYLKLSEEAFEFWNDPREEVYKVVERFSNPAR